MVVEFSRISWKILLEPLLMCSTVSSRYLFFFWVDVIAAVMAIIFLCKVLKSASRL
jgi:hypothetical protein